MVDGTESTTITPPWAEQFRAMHSLEAIPSPEHRDQFSDFLDIRAGSRDYLLQIREADFERSLAGGDTLKKELIHQIGNTIIRTSGLTSGNLPNWSFEQVDPANFARLQSLGKDQLIEELDKTTEELYKVFATGQVKPVITLPYGKSNPSVKYIEWMIRHEVGHEFSWKDAGVILGLERKPSVKKIWG